MASFATPTSSVTATALLQKRSPICLVQPSTVLGLPGMSKKMMIKGKVRCSIGEEEMKGSSSTAIGKGAALMAATSAAVLSSPAAMALVDERMSTEGVGLPFGLSNNLLGWILLGVFGLIWALYTIYSGTIDDDEESGLSL